MDNHAIVDLTEFEGVLAMARERLGLDRSETLRLMLDIAAWTLLRSTRFSDVERADEWRFVFTPPDDRVVFDEPSRFHETVIRLIDDIGRPSTQTRNEAAPAERATIIHSRRPATLDDSARIHAAAVARGFGVAQGAIGISPDFDAPLADVESFFE